MKKAKLLTVVMTIAIFVLACCVLAACNPGGDPAMPNANTDVVKAFNAITPTGDVLTQTATSAGDKYNVTVITTDYVAEYTLDKNFNVQNKQDIVGSAPSEATTAAEEQTALERAYAEALKLSGLEAANVTGFDFDRDTYMGKAVYKVEIEEMGAKYKYIFDAADFTLLDKAIEFENDMPTGSYITERQAYELALRAAGVTEDVSATAVVRSEFEDGRKIFKVSFNLNAYRYDVSVDAVSGDIVKYSKSALENKQAPAVAGDITAEQAKEIALAFVFPNGEERTEHTFRKVKRDYEDGQFVYEVELLAKNAEYEFEIAAKDGAILDVEIEGVKPQQSAPLPQDKQFITRDEAIAAVKKVAGNDAYVIEVEIDKEGGKYFYEIEVRLASGVKREYKVDALTGELLGNYAPADVVISENEAVLKALQAFELTEQTVDRKTVKLEYEDGVLCYTVKLYVGNTEYEAEIDAATGAVLKTDVDRDESHVVPPTTGDKLTSAQAVAKLKEYLGPQTNAFIGKAEYEYENGKFVYEIEVTIDGREYDYYVDATTGEVFKNNEFVSGGTDIITEEQAFDFALKAFGLDGRQAEIRLRKIKLDRDDFRLVYDVEFFIGNLKYEAEVDAATGAVIEKETSYD